MKRYWDLSEPERAALTREQVEEPAEGFASASAPEPQPSDSVF